MDVMTCKNGDIEIAYETFGTTGEPVLLIAAMGIESRLAWHEDFCEALVDKGFHVARFDNRDGGMSSRVAPGVKYSLREMADDTVAVLDALAWPSAHLFGLSLGGMIGQVMAVHHADRVRTLTSVASAPSNQWRVSRPKLGAAFKVITLGRKVGSGPDAAGDFLVEMFKIIGSPAYPVDEAWIRAISRRYPNDPAVAMRHLTAIRISGDRRGELARVTVPTLVLHGEDDPMQSMHAARETARAVPGARLVSYPGMGHDFPRELWPAMIAELVQHCQQNAASTTWPSDR
ncbi:MAG TPA: alpha/beta hydrolase [Pseudonocardiaceae bacterium]|jgi:pimeloyl-ACP methyl ester carboxylesterase